MRRLMITLGALLLCSTVPAPAADPPRIEQFSNPQSQTVGSRLCPTTPPVWVPYNDPCPGAAPAATAAPAYRPGAAAPMAAARPMLAPYQPATAHQQQALALYSSGMNARSQGDWGRAFRNLHDACVGTDFKRGCGPALQVLAAQPGEAARAVPRAMPAIEMEINGCRAGDMLACFAMCASSIAMTSGIRSVDADKVRRQCVGSIQPAEVADAVNYIRARADPTMQAPLRLDVPAGPSMWKRHGEYQERKGDRSLALMAYQKSLSLDDSDLGLQAKVGWLLCDGGRGQEAMTTFEKLLDRQPDFRPALDGYNACRSRLGLPAVTTYEPRTAGVAR